jgi:hypothetical protein
MRRLSVAVTLASLVLVVAGTTLAASRAQPSDRACLLAWNSPANHANRVRLLAERPISGLLLVPGVYGTEQGSPPKQTTAPVCILRAAKPGEIRTVTGIWKTAGVSSWSFGQPIPTSKPFFSNVRLLSDGRVTKIYRH